MNEKLRETQKAFQDPQWYFEKLGYHVRVRIETVREFLGSAQFNNILDIGCGDGSISLPLLTEQNYLTLLDMSGEMLARAQAKVPSSLTDRIKIIKGDFMSAQLEGGSYDLIICVGVLAYIDAMTPFVEKLAYLLKPGGKLIIEWTNGYHFINRILRPYHKLMSLFIRSKAKTIPHSSDEILGILAKQGFHIDRTYQYCSPLPLMRRALSQSYTYLLIRKMNGNVKRNSAAWLGDECIFYLCKPVV